MTASKHVTLWCDAKLPDGKPCVGMLEVGEARDVTTARKIAKNEGWRQVKGLDICPGYRHQEGTP